MLFNSKVFLLFVVGFFPLFYAVNDRARPWLLLVASYVFYGFWDPSVCVLIFLSTLLDFVCGHQIASTENDTARRRWLGLSLLGNLGALGFFKYHDFFVGEMAYLLSGLGFAVTAEDYLLRLMLPAGISFYTFQTMSYTIDIYRRVHAPEPSLLRFAVYVAYFPQLVAGPVERAEHLLPQLARPFTLTRALVMEGAFLILLGFVKKVVIADRLARDIAPAFEKHATDGALAAANMLLFTTQIYVDFSSYSDIAIGLGLLMGVRICANFDLPFVVPSIPERWRRWHLSMSRWFRDYIFIPLGGSRRGFWRTQVNILIVMFLSGLWHGASNNFVMWGVLNGLTMVGHAMVKPGLDRVSGVMAKANLTRVLYFYLCCWVTYCTIASINIFFRCPDWDTALSFWRAIYGSGLEPYLSRLPRLHKLPEPILHGAALTLLVFVLHEAERYLGVQRWVLQRPGAWAVFCVVSLWLIITFGISGPMFIYFQF
ncbi:MAG: MBOAT family protein [Deltaproteobacteria bacterium]|nr:MBOAT family protein [Deltaproteobacteria bacterium]